MANQLIYLRCVSAPISPNTIITPIGAGDYGQELTFNFNTSSGTYNSYFFGLFYGNSLPVKTKLPIDSNITITSIRLSIPNLPGARYAMNPNGAVKLIEYGYNIGIGGYTAGDVLTGTGFYPIAINNLNEWQDLNVVIDVNNYVNPNINTTYYKLAFGSINNAIQKISIDFRNFQTDFQSINIYLLAELQIIAPSGINL